ncbi:MAG: hypothetical protein WCE44_05185 [Candidatus Velthaea sp.]|jgi:hypothetical protein
MTKKTALLVLAAALLGAGPAVVDLHGTFVRYDRHAGLLVVHHLAQAAMEMEMTMAVKLRDPHAAARLRPGQPIRLHCDARPNPWVCDLVR